MLNAPPPKNAGTVKGKKVFNQPSSLKIINIGIITTCKGSIIVAKTKMNSLSLPGHCRQLNEYATTELDKSIPKIFTIVINIEFFR